MGIFLIITFSLLVKLQPEVSCSLFENSSLSNNIRLRRGSSTPDEDAILDSVYAEIDIHRSYAQLPPLKKTDGLVQKANHYIGNLKVQLNQTIGECDWGKTLDFQWKKLDKIQNQTDDGYAIVYYVYGTKEDKDELATHGGLYLVRNEYEKARGTYQFPGEGLPYYYCSNKTEPSQEWEQSVSAFTTIMRGTADQIGCAYRKNKRDPCSQVLCLFRTQSSWREQELMQNCEFEALNGNGEPLVSCDSALEDKVGGSQCQTLSYLLRLSLVFTIIAPKVYLQW